MFMWYINLSETIDIKFRKFERCKILAKKYVE